MNKIQIMIVSVILSVALLITGAWAQSGAPVNSENKGAQDYRTWASVVNSYLYDSENNTMTRVEYVNEQQIIVEKYDMNGNLLEQKIISRELELFGGFYTYNKYHYLVFGQMNDAQDDTAEVLRVVKYSNDWKRIGAASVYGENTVMPFDAGSLRMVGSGDYLMIRTCHLMYRSPRDGLRHQANMTISINTATMTVSEIHSKVSNSGTGYASHSFNQFVVRDGANLIAADHGDAYPRAIGLFRYSNAFNTGKLSCDSNNEVMTFNGNIGQNGTGASLGGLEVSDSNILLAGNSVDHKNNAELSANRNIFVAVADKNDMGNSTVKWMTSYPTNENQHVSTPQLVKVNGDAFLLMWTENDNVTKMRKLDGKGNVLESMDYGEKILSDCQPQMIGGRVRWYTTKDSGPLFYSIDPNDLSSLKKTGIAVLESVQLSEGELTLDEGQTALLKATIIPADTSEKVQITWRSLEPVIADVSADGLVTAKNHGETAIEVVATSPTHEYRDYCTIYVTNEHLATCPSRKFVDVERSKQHWTHLPIDYVLNKGYMAGISENRFSPSGTVTRGTIAQILYAAEGKPAVTKDNQFRDVASNQWYAKAVNWAAEKKLVAGYGNGKFGPDDPVTRQQMVAIMYQYAKMKGYDTAASGDLNGFADRNQVSSWAQDPMKWAVGHTVISGTGRHGIEPNGTATRAQIAVILQAFDKNVRK